MIDENSIIQQLQVSGGFTQSKEWLQLVADVTGKNLHLVHTEDASAVGAAYLALENLGYKLTMPEHSITPPRMHYHQIHQQNFSIYKTLYSSLMGAMHQLYQLNH